MVLRKKGQAAMEFLMTYGWAILVVLAAIGALAYFGVLSPDRFMPEKCTLPSGVACLDFTASQTQVVMRIQNSAGFDMSNVVVQVQDSNGTVNCAASGDTTLTNGETDTYTCAGTFTPGKLKSTVSLQYTNAQTGLSHTKTGELIAKVE